MFCKLIKMADNKLNSISMYNLTIIILQNLCRIKSSQIFIVISLQDGS